MNNSRKIGVLSGAFDPVHDGHIALAKAAREHAGLDKVFLLPERNLRRKANVTDFKHRLKMCELAAERFDWLEVLELSDDQFTVNKTLPELQGKFKNSELVLILGSDLFAHLPDWPGVEQLMTTVKSIVSLRDGHDESLVEDVALLIGAEFRLIENKFPKLSSGLVRERLKSGVKTGLDEKVAAYIKKGKLYEEGSSPRA